MIIVVMMIVFRIFKSILKTMTSLRQRQFFKTHFIIQRSTIMIVCTQRHQKKLVNNFIIIKVVALPGGMKMANINPPGEPEFTSTVFCGSLVAQSLNLCVVFRRSLVFFRFRVGFVLSVLRFTASDYTFKLLFTSIQRHV